MSDQLGINVSGIEECCSALDGMGARFVKTALGKALTAAAVPMVEALAARTPSRNDLFNDETFSRITGTADGGTLKDSLMSVIELTADGKGGRVRVGFGKAGFVARMVEYGHRSISRKAAKQITKVGKKGYTGELDGADVPAHPFMRPTAATAADASIEAFTASVKASLDEGI